MIMCKENDTATVVRCDIHSAPNWQECYKRLEGTNLWHLTIIQHPTQRYSDQNQLMEHSTPDQQTTRYAYTRGQLNRQTYL